MRSAPRLNGNSRVRTCLNCPDATKGVHANAKICPQPHEWHGPTIAWLLGGSADPEHQRGDLQQRERLEGPVAPCRAPPHSRHAVQRDSFLSHPHDRDRFSVGVIGLADLAYPS
jgi:hypothetical protein